MNKGSWLGGDVMPKFFFNLRNDVIVEDSEGKDLADADRARETAVGYARSIMSEDVKDGRLVLRDKIDVLDAQRMTVLTLPFRDAIEIEE
jgi:uncharacterized protein DUF6894